MIAWRLVRPPFGDRDSAFSGEGARLFGGRWNPPGIAVVYTSSSLALAALETLVHADRRSFERSYVAFRLEIPDDVIEEVADDALPADWRQRPVSAGARRLGDAWAARSERAVLSVPSVVVPLERNYLLNPDHPAFAEIDIGEPIPFRFDERL